MMVVISNAMFAIVIKRPVLHVEDRRSGAVDGLPLESEGGSKYMPNGKVVLLFKG